MADETTQFSIKFGGKPNTVNASTYGLVLVNTVTLFEEANKELETGAKLEIKVNSENEGSFLAAVGIEISQLPALLSEEHIKLASGIITGLIGLVTAALTLRKTLKDSTPKEAKTEGDIVQLTSSDGNKITVNKNVYNIAFNNVKTQKAMKTIFTTLDNDQAISDFSLLNEKEEPLFLVERKDFPELKALNLVPLTDKQYITDVADVYIVKLGFEKNLVWDFIYRGEKKSAYIKDDDFWGKFARREILFGNGDALKVELDIEQAFDESYGTFLNTGTIIIRKVLEVLPKPNPPKLFSDDLDEN